MITEAFEIRRERKQRQSQCCWQRYSQPKLSKREESLKHSEEIDNCDDDPMEEEDDIVDAEALICSQLPPMAVEGQCNKTLADRSAALFA